MKKMNNKGLEILLMDFLGMLDSLSAKGYISFRETNTSIIAMMKSKEWFSFTKFISDCCKDFKDSSKKEKLCRTVCMKAADSGKFITWRISGNGNMDMLYSGNSITKAFAPVISSVGTDGIFSSLKRNSI